MTNGSLNGRIGIIEGANFGKLQIRFADNYVMPVDNTAWMGFYMGARMDGDFKRGDLVLLFNTVKCTVAAPVHNYAYDCARMGGEDAVVVYKGEWTLDNIGDTAEYALARPDTLKIIFPVEMRFPQLQTEGDVK
jgi:hypothetical protein